MRLESTDKVISVIGSVLRLLDNKHCDCKGNTCWYANQIQIKIYDIS